MVQIPRWQVILATAVLLLALACASPNVTEAGGTEKVPGWLPSQESDLGLDLRGGSYLLLEGGSYIVIDGEGLLTKGEFEKAVAERLGNIADRIAAPLRRARIKHSSGVQGSQVFFELRDSSEMVRARDLIRDDVQTYVVSEVGPRIEIDVPEERMREIRKSIVSQFLSNEQAQTPPETNR